MVKVNSPGLWIKEITSFVSVEFERDAHDARKSACATLEKSEPGFFYAEARSINLGGNKTCKTEGCRPSI
jgi:hypothetical protein